MCPRIKEALAIVSVILVLVSVPMALNVYQHYLLESKYGKDSQIIFLYGTANGGKWVTKPINGMNYWWKKFNNSEVITVEVGKPVILLITSTDVLHSFSIPGIREWRRPIDIEAGTWKTVTFVPEEEGTLSFLCWQYCGDKHELMRGEIVVVAPHKEER